jgi:hypothetical protein
MSKRKTTKQNLKRGSDTARALHDRDYWRALRAARALAAGTALALSLVACSGDDGEQHTSFVVTREVTEQPPRAVLAPATEDPATQPSQAVVPDDKLLYDDGQDLIYGMVVQAYCDDGILDESTIDPEWRARHPEWECER